MLSPRIRAKRAEYGRGGGVRVGRRVWVGQAGSGPRSGAAAWAGAHVEVAVEEFGALRCGPHGSVASVTCRLGESTVGRLAEEARGTYRQ